MCSIAGVWRPCSTVTTTQCSCQLKVDKRSRHLDLTSFKTLIPNHWAMQLGDDPSKDDVKAFTEKTLSSGKVVPGFGHAVLRKTVSNHLEQPSL